MKDIEDCLSHSLKSKYDKDHDFFKKKGSGKHKSGDLKKQNTS
jgi:hypothetical protein